MIRIQALCKHFGNRQVLDNLNLEVENGQIMGLLGPNGAGKSTTMRILTGAIAPSSGEVYVNGYSVTGENDAWRAKLGYLPEQNPLYSELYTYEYLYYVAQLYKLKEARKRVAEIGELTGLTEMRNRRIKILSKGYKQRVGLAAALIADPETLILDEATSSIDTRTEVLVQDAFAKLMKGRTSFIIAHRLSTIQDADLILVLVDGDIVEHGNHHDLMARKGKYYQMQKAATFSSE